MIKFARIYPKDLINALIRKEPEVISSVLFNDTFTPWALISIYGGHEESPFLGTPENTEVLKSLGCVGIHCSRFVDITKPHYKLYSETYDKNNTVFNYEHSEKIVNFLDEVNSIADNLIVHCDAGKARSGAIGAFAVKYLGMNERKFFESEKHWINPNPWILQTIMKYAGMQDQYEDYFKLIIEATEYPTSKADKYGKFDNGYL